MYKLRSFLMRKISNTVIENNVTSETKKEITKDEYRNWL